MMEYRATTFFQQLARRVCFLDLLCSLEVCAFIFFGLRSQIILSKNLMGVTFAARQHPTDFAHRCVAFAQCEVIAYTKANNQPFIPSRPVLFSTYRTHSGHSAGAGLSCAECVRIHDIGVGSRRRVRRERILAKLANAAECRVTELVEVLRWLVSPGEGE